MKPLWPTFLFHLSKPGTSATKLVCGGQNLYSLARDGRGPEGYNAGPRAIQSLTTRWLRIESCARGTPILAPNWLDSKPADATRFDVRLSNRIGNVSATFLDGEGEAGQMLIRPTICGRRRNSGHASSCRAGMRLTHLGHTFFPSLHYRIIPPVSRCRCKLRTRPQPSGKRSQV
jgi:hypothetical protein